MEVKTLDSNQARNHWREMLDTVLKIDADVVRRGFGHAPR
jgi:hypothetical protein